MYSTIIRLEDTRGPRTSPSKQQRTDREPSRTSLLTIDLEKENYNKSESLRRSMMKSFGIKKAMYYPYRCIADIVKKEEIVDQVNRSRANECWPAIREMSHRKGMHGAR